MCNRPVPIICGFPATGVGRATGFGLVGIGGSVRTWELSGCKAIGDDIITGIFGCPATGDDIRGLARGGLIFQGLRPTTLSNGAVLGAEIDACNQARIS